MSDEMGLETDLDREQEDARLARDNELIQLRSILDTPNGRAAVWRILSRTRMFSTPFVVGSPDATAFNLGEQNVGLWLLAEVTSAGAHYYALMQQESSE